MKLKIAIYLMRLIALPFFAAIGLIYSIKLWVLFITGFLLRGGEALVYKNDHDKSVAEILNYLKDKIEVEKRESCNSCGGEMVIIRGRHPGDDKRKVCPTCSTENLETLINNDIKLAKNDNIRSQS
jgi:hypothetical protein